VATTDARLVGKNALVTGGSRGIGHAIAAEYLRHGADVAVLSCSVERLGAAVDDLRAVRPGAKVVGVAADVADRDAVERAVAEAIGALGAVDVLVNAAGIASLGDLDVMSPAEWERIIAVNLVGVYNVTHAVWPHMKQHGGGSILMIVSGSGRRAHGGWSAYCASKFGLMGLTQALAKEGRPHGIRCNALCPGPTDTDQRRANFPGEDPAGLLRPEQVASASVFFASDESRWVSGPGIDVRREPV